jgi:hypothetical protein
MTRKPTPKPNGKPKPKLSDKEQSERFIKTARELGCDNPESVEKFEKAFGKIVPPKSRSPEKS